MPALFSMTLRAPYTAHQPGPVDAWTRRMDSCGTRECLFYVAVGDVGAVQAQRLAGLRHLRPHFALHLRTRFCTGPIMTRQRNRTSTGIYREGTCSRRQHGSR